MDRVLSARVDEAVLRRIGSLARRLGTSKKSVIENAIRAYADEIDRRQCKDVFEQTSGAWRRKEPANQIVNGAGKRFRDSMERGR